jgi:hypothetical protein
MTRISLPCGNVSTSPTRTIWWDFVTNRFDNLSRELASILFARPRDLKNRAHHNHLSSR